MKMMIPIGSNAAKLVCGPIQFAWGYMEMLSKMQVSQFKLFQMEKYVKPWHFWGERLKQTIGYPLLNLMFQHNFSEIPRRINLDALLTRYSNLKSVPEIRANKSVFSNPRKMRSLSRRVFPFLHRATIAASQYSLRCFLSFYWNGVLQSIQLTYELRFWENSNLIFLQFKNFYFFTKTSESDPSLSNVF